MSLDCQQSFDLGKDYAKKMHNSLVWYFLGIGSSLLVFGMARPLVMEVDPNSWVIALVGVGATVATITPFVSALLFPKRVDIFPPSSEENEVELECYRDGYVRWAKWRNCGVVLWQDSVFLVPCWLICLGLP